MQALIGHTGFIGKHLLDKIKFDHLYNSSTINDIKGQTFDVVYCAAPSGNRLTAVKNPEQDLHSANILISALSQVCANRFILISTVDTVHAPDTAYGKNRFLVEEFVARHFEHCHILRLCVLISSDIRKNVLHDIKHGQYLDSINEQAVNQWYPLNRLVNDIDIAVTNNIAQCNLVSEPVSNKELFADFDFQKSQHVKPYNLHCSQAELFGGSDGYIVSKEQVKILSQEYLNDCNS